MWPISIILTRFKAEKKRRRLAREKHDPKRTSKLTRSHRTADIRLDHVKLETISDRETSTAPTLSSTTLIGDPTEHPEQQRPTSQLSLTAKSRTSFLQDRAVSIPGEIVKNPIQQFLETLDGPVDDSLCALLLKEGFRTHSDLRALAHLPDKAAILYRFVETQQLTYWQFVLLRRGLDRLEVDS
ncbi:hypothetical protein CERSUDRAFT_94087 [Gelatoporia subvermispora B]|uniref:Uncharacterized protein n=1 Tax=Ceriporiopsis subvermispora (strain B) TaxID=914234 RepID=M2PPW0_CERS8|nr:hypothetical protein CERSUDRAFT_94087 [Gelatoporia subvermispora B]